MLAQCSLYCDDVESSLIYAERGLGIIRTLEQSPRVSRGQAECLSTIAGCYERAGGRKTESADAYQRALVLFTKVGDKSEVFVVTSKLAKHYVVTGQHDRAMESLHRAAAICATIPGGSWIHADGLTENISAMGIIHVLRGRAKEARECFFRVLDARERSYGKHSSEVAHTISRFETSIGTNCEENKALFERALAIYERRGLRNTEQCAPVLTQLGIYNLRLGLVEVATGHLDRALLIHRTLLPPDHPSTAFLLKYVAEARSTAGNEVAAQESLDASIAIDRRSQVACAGPGCTRKLREDGGSLDVCVNCRRTCYCGKACQTADWKKGHKAECKALIAEASARKVTDAGHK